jgi:REP element-mobilizing transposase RayT
MLMAMRYRRLHVPNALVFLTVVTHRREPVLLRPDVRAAFRRAFAHVAARHPGAPCMRMWSFPIIAT